MQTLQSALGVFAFIGFAWAISENRRAVSWKLAAIGLVATFATAAPAAQGAGRETAFAGINDAVGAISAATRAGTSFVFGYLGGGALPYDLKTPGADFVLALQALPVVLVMSVLTTLLFYWRILPPIVRGFACCCSNGRSASAARSACRPPPTSFSAWSRRRCSSGRISPRCRAANCSS